MSELLKNVPLPLDLEEVWLEEITVATYDGSPRLDRETNLPIWRVGVLARFPGQVRRVSLDVMIVSEHAPSVAIDGPAQLVGATLTYWSSKSGRSGLTIRARDVVPAPESPPSRRCRCRRSRCRVGRGSRPSSRRAVRASEPGADGAAVPRAGLVRVAGVAPAAPVVWAVAAGRRGPGRGVAAGRVGPPVGGRSSGAAGAGPAGVPAGAGSSSGGPSLGRGGVPSGWGSGWSGAPSLPVIPAPAAVVAVVLAAWPHGPAQPAGAVNAGLTTPVLRSGYHLNLSESAGEAGGSLVLQAPRVLSGAGGGAAKPVAEGLAGEVARAIVQQRQREEADRRARGKLRRYAVSNRLNRLGTLTYATSCRDPLAVRRDVGLFFRKLRAGLGGRPLPYVWVPEWHPGGHGLHVHFLLGQYVPRRLIEQAWAGKGFCHIKLVGDLPGGDGDGGAGGEQQQAARAAKYASKYVGKTLDGRRPGLHRFDCAQGFQPAFERVWGHTARRRAGGCGSSDGGRPVLRLALGRAVDLAGSADALGLLGLSSLHGSSGGTENSPAKGPAG